jgi:tetratricopeptide (TPR) repeat protein
MTAATPPSLGRSRISRPRPASWILCLGLWTWACSSSPNEPDPKEQLKLHREFALRYFDQGDLVRAEHQCNRGLEIDPKDKTLVLMAGWIRQRRGTAKDILVAEQIFRELAPKDDYRSLLGLGQALERKGILFDEAAVAVAEGRREPEGGGDPAERAKQLARDARAAWRESIECYEKTLEKKPGEFQAYNGMQRVYALRGEYAESLRWADRLLEESQAEIGFWNKQLARPDLSAEEEERLRGLLEGSTKLLFETRLTASNLLVELDRKAEAVTHLDAALELQANSPDVLGRRGQLLCALGRQAEALADLRNFLKYSTLDFEHPDVRQAWSLIEECEQELQRQQRAQAASAARG